MSASATQATPQHDPGPPPADAPYYRGILHGMIDEGASLTHALHDLAIAHAAQQATALAQQAAAPVSHAPAPHAADAPAAPVPATSPAPDAVIRIAATFDQIARAVRRCIAQAQSLGAPKQQQQPARQPAQQAPDRTTARKRILRAVEDVIQRPPDNDECDDAEVLLADLRERMDAPDLDDDITTRPAEDIIKEILRDLGLAALPGSRPWKRRTQADITVLNARAAAPTSPRQPSAGPHDPKPGSAQPASQDNRPEPAEPAATPREQPGITHPGPIPPGNASPDDPAEAVPLVSHRHAGAGVPWRPPPGD